ncbi:hypothetical protein [Flavobacteriaceae bacterium 14752]|uniref:hypothetical protein n=1 Tax=Mesohalobacter salilacus TaxID=2491711 RepID=UPI000F63D936|nr:hypothetical protein EIG84_05365 [Flavobacteriaceae bacterium 14752]
MNKKALNKVLFSFLIILLLVIGFIFILTLTFFYNYSGNQIPNYYFYLALVSLLIVGIGLYKLSQIVGDYEIKNAKVINDSDYNKWKKIKINANDVIVISSPYYREVPKSSSMQIQAYDSLLNDGGVKREQLERVYLEFEYQNKKYRQEIGEINEVSLKMKLAKLNNINLYINQNNSNEYYFELQKSE